MTGNFEGLETAAPLADTAEVGELPPELPVLPLKETVVFPDSMSPLAIALVCSTPASDST